MNPSTLLQARDLIFGHERPLGPPLQLAINEGDYIFIAGANGSGKTTLIKTLTGKISPLDGSLESTAKFGHLPQQHQNDFNLPLTIAELCELYGVKQAHNPLIQSIAAHLKWFELSGGMRQRILLALILAQQPDILILDEPANHLDQSGLLDLTNALNTIVDQSLVKALIVVSHVTLNLHHPPTKVITL